MLITYLLKNLMKEPVCKNTDEDITAIYGMAAEIPDKKKYNNNFSKLLFGYDYKYIIKYNDILMILYVLIV